jgi:diguanylate cyclase (GGDEF)-like protein
MLAAAGEEWLGPSLDPEFMRRQYGPVHLGFLGAVGLGGLVAVTALTTWPPALLRPWDVGWPLMAVLGLCIAARFLAFKVFRQVRIALDSVFYVAAAFAFGVVPAAWLVLIVLGGHALVRVARGQGDGSPEPMPGIFQLAHIFYSGGLPALTLLATGLLLDVDGIYPRADLTLAWYLPLFAVTFLVSHYLFAGGSHWLEGALPADVWRNFFLRVIASELILTPLTLAMVWGYHHQGIAPFLLLGATALLFNWIYRRAHVARDNLDARVQELVTLVRVGKIISGSLERRVLLENISSETIRVVGHNSRFMIGLVDNDTQQVDYELFDERGHRYRHLVAAADAGLSGWVMANRRPLLLEDVQRDYSRFAKTDQYNDPRFNSWIGVPLITYDDVMGIISLQTEERQAYTQDHLRVLNAIADQAAVALENSRLYELATIDGLTRLLVRRHFDLRLREEWSRAQRYQGAFSLGIFDLDNFKDLNDTFGHQAGDQVLRAAAATVRKNMRSADLAGRYGGEEFAFLLPRTALAEAATVAERIRADVAALVVDAAGTKLSTHASIGVAAFPESGVTSAEELIARADEALYQAKRAGKNRVVVAQPVGAGGKVVVADA